MIQVYITARIIALMSEKIKADERSRGKDIPAKKEENVKMGGKMKTQ